MKNANKIINKYACIGWILASITVFLKVELFDSCEWFNENYMLIGVMLISLPTIVILACMDLKPESFIYDKKLLIYTEIEFTVLFLIPLFAGCNKDFTILCWTILSILVIIAYAHLKKYGFQNR